MPPLLTVVTCTRTRPLCFSLLERWMKHQTVQPDQWLVVGEDHAGYRFTQGQEVIQRVPTADRLHSHNENWRAALPAIAYENVIVMEDDDYYHARYLETLLGHLEEGKELVGVKQALYYHLPGRQFKRLLNQGWACLGASGFKKSIGPFLKTRAEAGNPDFGVEVWNDFWDSRSLVPNEYKGKVDTKPLVLGMKGMPGCQGIGIYHHPGYGWSSDRCFVLLSQWLGADAKAYKAIKFNHRNTSWGKADWQRQPNLK